MYPFTAQDPYEAMQAGMAQSRINRLADIDVAEKARAFEASKALNELYNKLVDPVTGQIDRNRLYGGMAARGYGGMIPGLQTAQAELEAKQAKAFLDQTTGAKNLSEVEAASVKATRDALAPVNTQEGWDAWRARAKQQFRNVPNIDQVFDQIIPAQYTPENKLNALQVADTILPKGEVKEIGGYGVTFNPYTGKQIGPAVTTPGAQADLAIKQSREARLAAQDKSLEDQSVLGHDALVNAATRYNIDGTLPPLGMGKAGAKTRGAILDMAAELAKGIDPTDQRLKQISTKANASALSDITKREAQVSSFERTFTKNADIVENLATKLDQSGSPIIQKWINAGKKRIAGDPDIAAFDIAIKSAQNEYTKIVSGSMGNTAIAQSEIKRIEDLLNNAQTIDQVKAVLNIMRQETANRMAGFKEEKDRLRGDISAKPAAAATATPAPAAPGGIVNVKTVEEARNLAPGTQFITPDGRIKVR